MTSAADDARRHLSRHGDVQATSAKDALLAAINPVKPKPQKPMHWSEVATKLKAINDALEAQQKADAEAAANPPAQPLTAAQAIARAIAGNAGNVPALNGGAALLKNALGGGAGTIHGEPA
jgi:hypothetical protein